MTSLSEVYKDKEMLDYINKEFKELGISYSEIIDSAIEHQSKHFKSIPRSVAVERFSSIMHKREVLNIIMTALALDDLANKGMLPEPLQEVVAEDNGLFGVDELLGVGLSQYFGTISTTNYGYLDVNKTNTAKHLDSLQKSGKSITVFIDDIVSSLTACLESSIAHTLQETTFNDMEGDDKYE